MIDGVGIEGMNEAQVVRHAGKVREQFAHPDAALSLLGELEGRGRDQLLLPPGHRGNTLSLADGFGQLGFEELVQIGLVIKQVHLARGAGHEQEDDSFGLGLDRSV